jgi:hypothetical protein
MRFYMVRHKKVDKYYRKASSGLNHWVAPQRASVWTRTGPAKLVITNLSRGRQDGLDLYEIVTFLGEKEQDVE